jgi:hypothetical protein
MAFIATHVHIRNFMNSEIEIRIPNSKKDHQQIFQRFFQREFIHTLESESPLDGGPDKSKKLETPT